MIISEGKDGKQEETAWPYKPSRIADVICTILLTWLQTNVSLLVDDAQVRKHNLRNAVLQSITQISSEEKDNETDENRRFRYRGVPNRVRLYEVE